MYHRFEENKYPSTNIRIKDFKEHIEKIKKSNFTFVNANNFKEVLESGKNKKKLLLTIDDAYTSFYKKAWPILKKNKIPFILFVNTREVGLFNYMTWKQIKEISLEEFVHIGNHSHSHEYLVDLKPDEIEKDIKKSIEILNEKIGYNTEYFSYPFGEYSSDMKKIIKDLKFKYAFGQHSGVIDITKDYFELPRFPINEKYGESKRFEMILNTLPFKYKKISPEEKFLNNKTNPPNVIVEFYDDIKNLHLINCYSNELNIWRKSKINFINKSKMEIKLQGKFTTERGRINCSLRVDNQKWRWLGMQFVIAEK
jgi:poly-beta-1,6-N-acetyl-D-glucosamine N-deacetylase